MPLESRLRLESKIVGGREAREPNDFPWQLHITTWVITNAEGHKEQTPMACGGVLLNKRFAISAAHCFMPQEVGYNVMENVSISQINLVIP